MEKIIDGKTVSMFTLKNSNGMSADITNFGAKVVRHDEDGRLPCPDALDLLTRQSIWCFQTGHERTPPLGGSMMSPFCIQISRCFLIFCKLLCRW